MDIAPRKKVVVASSNPVKIEAVVRGFERMFPVEHFDVSGVSVPSGVAHQPMNDEETRRGAQNRARNAAQAAPQADFWAGIEGGIDTLDGQMSAFAWIIVLKREGGMGESRSASFPLPPAIVELIQQGVELGEADDRVFRRRNSKQANGAVGILTEDAVDRVALYEQPVALALIPFKNPDLYDG